MPIDFEFLAPQSMHFLPFLEEGAQNLVHVCTFICASLSWVQFDGRLKM